MLNWCIEAIHRQTEEKRKIHSPSSDFPSRRAKSGARWSQPSCAVSSWIIASDSSRRARISSCHGNYSWVTAEMDDDGRRSRAASVVHSIIVSNTQLWWTLDSLTRISKFPFRSHVLLQFTTLEEKTIAGAEAIMLRIWIILDGGKKLHILATIAAADWAWAEKEFHGRERKRLSGENRDVSQQHAETANCSFVSMSFTYSTHTTSAPASRASGPHEI